MQWDNGYFDNLFGYEWELTKSPAGAYQWMPKDAAAAAVVPRAHDPSKRVPPVMLTTDLSLRFDPIYLPISQALPRAPGSARRRVRPGVVQADAPRHGPARALSRPGGPRGGFDLAGPRPGGHASTDRRAGHSRAQEPRSSRRVFPSPNWSRPHGRRRRPSAAPTSAAGRTGRASASRRRRIGRSTSPPNWRPFWRPSRASRRRSTRRSPGASGFRSPT